MRKALPWIALAVGGAAVVHLLVVHLLPSAIMAVAMRRVAADRGVNTATFAPRADDTARAIVRPSPDLLYSICVFDVSQRPLRLIATVPRDTYWSLSMFAANTDNFYKLNDADAAGGKVDIVLAPKGASAAAPAGTRLVETPTARGIILTRTLVNDEARLPELDAARRLFTCAPL